MVYRFDYSKEKDLILREARGVGFENVIEAIKKGNLLDNISHFNEKKYPNQKIFIIKIKRKVYAVPYQTLIGLLITRYNDGEIRLVL